MKNKNRKWMSLFYATLFFSFAQSLIAAHNHSAHEHGIGRLHIAVDSKKIRLELELPADTAYGFEHPAKSAKEKAAVEKISVALKNPVALFVFEGSLKCELKTVSINPWVEDEDHDGHGELHAAYEAVCTKSLSGTKLKIALDRALPRLHELRIESIGDENQSSLELKRGAGEIKL